MNTFKVKKDFYSNTGFWSFCCILFSIYAIWLSYNGINGLSIRMQERFWNEIGFLSIFLGIGSFVSWFIKKRIIKLKKIKSGFTIRYLRESHIALGWLAFATALGHSFFFIINDLGRTNRNFTGYIAFFSMLLVILTGIFYKHKVLKISIIRYWHMVIAIVLSVILFIHI